MVLLLMDDSSLQFDFGKPSGSVIPSQNIIQKFPWTVFSRLESRSLPLSIYFLYAHILSISFFPHFLILISTLFLHFRSTTSPENVYFLCILFCSLPLRTLQKDLFHGFPDHLASLRFFLCRGVLNYFPFRVFSSSSFFFSE